jgi:hypothetical protein
MIIDMMGTAHPHSQASEASALGGGGQKFPRNGGRRGGAKRAYSPPRVSDEIGLSIPLNLSVAWMNGCRQE